MWEIEAQREKPVRSYKQVEVEKEQQYKKVSWEACKAFHVFVRGELE